MLKGVGVYIGRNEVIAVSAVRTSSGPQVKAFASEPIQSEAPQEPAEDKKGYKIKRATPEAQAIRRALDKIKEKGAYVTVAVSPSLVATRHFIMPSIPKRDEVGAIRHEATRYIPFKLSDSIMDYHSQTTHKNVSSVTVTAIRKEVLQTSLEDLRSASAKVLMIEPVYCAVGRAFSALRMLASAKTQGFVVLQSDGNVHVTFASNGIVYLSRDFLLSWNSDEDKSRFTDELKASIDYFFKLTGGEALTQIFLAGAGDLKLWAEHLEHAFNYTIRFDSANFPNEKNIPPESLHSVLVAFGLALRSLNYSSPLGDIKLLPQADRKSEPSKMLTFLGAECAILLILFIAARLVIFQPILTQLKNENTAVLGAAVRDNPQLMSQSMDELAAQQNALRPRLDRLGKFLKSRERLSALLAALGQGLPESISLDTISFEEVGSENKTSSGKVKKRLSVKGLCYLGSAEKETNVISGWAKSLSLKKPLSSNFSEIKLEEVSREKTQDQTMTRFSILGE
jgi:Tfp pilus assembly PilM family ATPase/Tfp pilus assembly protein PilN